MASKWQTGVSSYVIELLETFNDNYPGEQPTREKLLNGADNWSEYSYGGTSEVYDYDIAERLATPSEIKSRTRKDGSFNSMANARETWLDVQARALSQACSKILRGVK